MITPKCNECGKSKWVVKREVKAREYKRISDVESANGQRLKYKGLWQTDDSITTKAAYVECNVCENELTIEEVKRTEGLSSVKIEKNGVVFQSDGLDRFFGEVVEDKVMPTKDFDKIVNTILKECGDSADIEIDVTRRLIQRLSKPRQVELITEACSKSSGLTSTMIVELKSILRQD